MTEAGGRPQWLVPAGIGLLIVILAVVALARDPVQLDPSSPEGTVQTYLQAIGDEDYQRAMETLDPDEFEGCVPADIARFAPDEPFTATLDEEPVTRESDRDETVIVSVHMRFGTEGLLGNSWETWETFTLVDDGGSWLITEDPWPHFTWDCTERNDA